MPPVGFEPAIPARELPQTDALDGAATGIALLMPVRPFCDTLHSHCFITIRHYQLNVDWGNIFRQKLRMTVGNPSPSFQRCCQCTSTYPLHSNCLTDSCAICCMLSVLPRCSLSQNKVLREQDVAGCDAFVSEGCRTCFCFSRQAKESSPVVLCSLSNSLLAYQSFS
jgi:hypothetical protein